MADGVTSDVPRASLTRDLQLSFRAAAAAGISVGVAELLRLPFPIYAMVAAVIVTDLSPAQTRRLGVPRAAGTVMGATLGAVLSALLLPAPGAIALGIFAAMSLSHLAGQPAAAKVAGYVCAITLIAYGDHPWTYAWYRLLETLLGIVMAILVSLVPKVIRS